jgi:putative ABC transport system substrate-binding protein
MAIDLVNNRVTVIAATTTQAALAARAATSTIPIVFETGADPVELGFVASLSRPGGNATGAASLVVDVIAAKGLEVLHELIPQARVMGLLINPNSSGAERQEKAVWSYARTIGLDMHVSKASGEGDFDKIFSELVELRAAGLVISADAFFSSQMPRLAALAVRHAIPTLYSRREFPAAGGLASYGSDVAEAYRLAGLYTGRVLKGEKPADLPVQQATKVDLVINLKAASALGITVPLPLLGRADEVIE